MHLANLPLHCCPWVALHGGDAPAHESQVVATLVRVAGLWMLNPCRVIHAPPPSGSVAGFAYGTLAGHASVGGAHEVGKRLTPGTLLLGDLVVLVEVVVVINLLLVVELAVVAVVVVNVGELVAARVLGCDMHTQSAW